MIKTQPDIDRILANVEIGDCWLYLGYIGDSGYGSTVIGSTTNGTARKIKVHRFVYESLVGPVPLGLELDHLCRVRACCNPDHLEPVTDKVNAVRGRAGYNTPKLGHCRKQPEHVFPEHAQHRANGTRYCKTCANRQQREQYAARGEAA